MSKIRKRVLAAVVTAFVAVTTFGVVAVNAHADDPGDEYTATITSSNACIRWDPYGDSRAEYCKTKGEKEILTCKLTNKHGNLWYKTNYKGLASKRLHIYSGHVSSAYKNILPKC